MDNCRDGQKWPFLHPDWRQGLARSEKAQGRCLLVRLSELQLAIDDEDTSGKKYKLLKDVYYRVRHPKVRNLVVPEGFKTDLATLPPGARGLIWAFGYKHAFDSAGVLHDFLLGSAGHSKMDAHRIFYQELGDQGVPLILSMAGFAVVTLWCTIK